MPNTMIRKLNIFTCLLNGLLIILGLYVPFLNLIALVVASYYIVFRFRENELVSFVAFLIPFATIFKLTIPGFSFYNIILICALFRSLLLLNFKIPYKIGISLILFSFFVVVTSLQADLIASLTIACSVFLVVCITANGKKEISFLDIVHFTSFGVILTSVVAALGTGVFSRISPLLGTTTIRLEAGVYYYRFAGLFGNPNHFSFIVSILLASICVIILKKEAKLIDYVIFALLSIFGFMSVSMSFIIAYAFMFVMILYTGIKNGGKRLLQFFAIVAIAVVVLVVFLDTDTLSTIAFRFDGLADKQADVSSMTTGRSDLWLMYLKHFTTDIKTLMVGVGMGAANLSGGASHNFYIEIIYYLDSYSEFDKQSKKKVTRQFMGGKMNSMCGLVWRKAIFIPEAFELPEEKIRNGEDRLQKSIILYCAQTIAYIPKVIYHYKWYPGTQGGDVRRGLLNVELYRDFKAFWSVERRFYDDFGFSMTEKAEYSLQKVTQILGMLEKTYNNKWLKKNDIRSLMETIARDEMFSVLEKEMAECNKRKHIDTMLWLLRKSNHSTLFAYFTLCNLVRRLKYGKGK